MIRIFYLMMFVIAGFMIFIMNINKQQLKEHFETCFKRSNHFDSIENDIFIDRSQYFYEMPLSEFRQWILKHKIKSKSFIKSINLKINPKTPKFKIVKQYKNEHIIYRTDKAYGFHVKTRPKNQPIEIIGIVNEYDISYLDRTLIRV